MKPQRTVDWHSRRRQVEWQCEQQKRLMEIALRIHQFPHLQDGLKFAVAEIQSFLQTEQILLYQVQLDGEGIIRALAGSEKCFSTHDSCIGDIYIQAGSFMDYCQGRTWVSHNVAQEDLPSAQLQVLAQFGVKASLVVPILIPPQPSTSEEQDPTQESQTTETACIQPLWGLLILHQCTTVRDWQLEEVMWLEQLAAHMAIAIAQAERYEQLQTELSQSQHQITVLQQEHRFTTAVLDVVGALIVVLDATGRIVRFNEACQHLSGYTLEAIRGQQFWDLLLLPEEQETCKVIFRELKASQFPWQSESYWVTKRGDRRLVAWSATVLLDGNGAVEYVIGTGEDVTERRQTEKALSDSEAMHRAIRDALPDLTIRMQRQGTYLDFIPAKTFPIVMPDSNMRGLSVFDALPTDAAQERLRYAELALATGKPQTYEYQLEIGGQLYWQEARLVASGVDEVLVIIRSIQDRKLAEQALAESEARLWAVVQHSFDIITIVDENGTRRFVNESVRQVLGYTPDEMMGRNAFDGIHPDDMVRVQFAFQAALEQPKVPIRVEFRYQHCNGYWVDLELVGTNLLHQPEIKGIVANLRDVSARKCTENYLRESERRYATLADAVPVGLFRTDGDGSCIYVNERWSEITGLSFQDGLGDGWVNCLHPEHRDRILATWMHGIQQKIAFCHELLLVCPANSIRWAFCQVSPEIDDSGNVIGFIGSLTDITPQKQVEAELRESQQRMQAIASNLPSSAYQCVAHPDGTISLPFVSPGAEELTGVSPAAIQANPAILFTMIHPDDRDGFIDQVQHSIATLANFQHEYRIITRSGEMKWVRDLARYSRRENGDIVANGIAIDISDRRQTEEALQKSEALLRAMFERSGVGIVILGANGQILQANPAYQTMLGYSEAELQTMQFMDLTYHEDCAPNLALFESLMQGECGVYQIEKRYHRCNGDIIWVRVTSSLIASVNEQPKLLMAVIEDITDRKRAEAALHQLNRELEARIEQRTLELRQAVVWLEQEIQERKQAEKELQASEERLRLFIEYAPAAVAVFDQEMRYLAVSQRWLKDYQIETQNIIGKSHYEVFSNQPDQWKELHQQCLSGVVHTCEDDFYVLPNGNPCWLRWEIRPWRYPTGDIGGIIMLTEVITKRRQTEVALRESEEKFRQLAENIDSVFWIQDTSDRLLYVSPSYEKIWGTPATTFYGQTGGWLDAVYPDDRDQVKQAKTSILSGDFNLEYRICRPDGSLRWVHDRAFPVQNEAGEIYRVVGIAEDITDRKQAELALRHNQDLREAIFDESADAIFLVNTTTLLTMECNTRAVELFEANSKDDLIGIAGHSLQQTQFSLQEIQAIADEMAAKGFWSAEIKYVTKRGNLFWGSLAARTIHVAGQVMNLVRVTDISDRKQAELLQRQQIERELLLASITQRIQASLDLQTILNTTVEETKRLLQVDRVLVYRILADGTGKAIAEMVSPGWQPILDREFPPETFPSECYQFYFQGGCCVLSDREQGTIAPCLVEFMAKFQIRAKLVAPIVGSNHLWGLLIAHQCDHSRYWQEGEINLLLQIGNQLSIAIQQSELYQQLQQELDERIQAEAQLQQTNAQLSIANAELARATRHKDEFLANMSHELRTPLNAILGMAEALIEEVCGTLSDRQRKAISTIEKSGKHLLALINDILDLAKIEAGKLELDLSKTAVKNLCDSSLTFVRQMALHKNIQLIADIPTDIKEIHVDNRRIQQVLINLLSNAIKFTPDGGSVRLQVWEEYTEVLRSETQTENRSPRSDWQQDMVSDVPFQASAATPQVVFAIIDTGIGIAQENIAKVFQPFVQIDSSLNRQYSGTGLGLALVRRIVEMHSGTIMVDSVVGQGSCFTVRLPRRQTWAGLARLTPAVPPQESESTQDEVRPQPSVRFPNPPRILLVEDNETNIETISEYLTFEGYELLLAMNGEEAINTAKAEHPDLILMDIQMPGIDGLEAIRIIRADTVLATVPIIAVTALAMAGDRTRCLSAGANVYLTKPIGLKQLVKTIQKFTNQ